MIGGLENEWLNLVVKDLFDPAHGLFKVAENGVTIQPSPQSHVVSNYLAYFRLAGYIVGYVRKYADISLSNLQH